jgi:hypothetical protein
MPERWRGSPGVFDLLKECAVAVRTKDDPQPLNTLIAKYFREHTLSVAFPGFADYPISFLGPGRQDSVNYKEDLMAADWVRFFEVNAEDFRLAFRQEVERQQFTVIIDTRTGANLASLFVLDALAGNVYLVSPRTYQALEGTYWMRQMLRSMHGGFGSANNCKLILSRHTTLHASTREADDISTAIGRFFGTSAPDFQFPHLDCLSNQEKLVFSDSDLAAVLFPPASSLETEDPAASAYRLNFWNLCQEIGAIAVEAPRLKEIATRIESARQTERLTPRSFAQFAEGRKLAEQLLLSDTGSEKTEPDRPRQSGESEKQKQSGEPQLNELLNWIARANVFARTALSLDLSSPANVDRLPGFAKDKLKEKLRFDWTIEPFSPAAASRPTFDQLPVAPHHAKPSMQSGQSELSIAARQQAFALYHQGLKERDGNDDPAKAETLLAQALDAAQKSLDGAGFDQRERLENSRVIYAWEQAITMSMFHPSADVIAFIEQAIHIDRLPEARGGDSNMIVKADYCRLYLSLCCGHLDERRAANAKVDADMVARAEEIRNHSSHPRKPLGSGCRRKKLGTSAT